MIIRETADAMVELAVTAFLLFLLVAKVQNINEK